MAKLTNVEAQLKAIGCNFRYLGRPEIRELEHIIMPGEEISQCVNGQYEGGTALLCATNHRLLLIDKKPLYLTIEDIRYNMIAEVGYSHRLLDATIRIFTTSKSLNFTTMSRARLRKILNIVQHEVTHVRNKQSLDLRVNQQAAAIVPVPLGAPQASFQDMAQQQMQPVSPIVDNFNGFRRHVSLKIAHYVGPRAVAFSQLPPTLSMYKIPFSRRRPTTA
jgi:Bacterial PH domain